MKTDKELKEEILDEWIESLFPKAKYPKVNWEVYKNNKYAGMIPAEVEKIIDLTIQKLTEKHHQELKEIEKKWKQYCDKEDKNWRYEVKLLQKSHRQDIKTLTETHNKEMKRVKDSVEELSLIAFNAVTEMGDKEKSHRQDISRLKAEDTRRVEGIFREIEEKSYTHFFDKNVPGFDKMRVIKELDFQKIRSEAKQKPKEAMKK